MTRNLLKMRVGYLFMLYVIIALNTTVDAAANPPAQASLTCAVICPDTPQTPDGGSTQQLSTISTDMIKQLINETRANARLIDHLKKDLCDLRDRSETTGVVLNNVLSLTEEIVALLNDTTSTPLPLPTSCKNIKQRTPSSPSGEYQIINDDNQTQYVYCNMETLCGSDEGWTRLAHINMTDPSENCPGGLRLHQANGKRACGRPTSGGASCHSIKYPSHGVQYSRVCGKAIGYQYYSPDAVDYRQRQAQRNDINSYYVDGISLTRGSPRQHIWTLMAGIKEDNSHDQGKVTCPCQTGSKQSNNIPTLIGDDYYCESGNPSQPSGFPVILYTADPLWDGTQCGGLELPCCVRPGLPWFNKQLGKTTNDYIEVRVCADEGTANEDTPIEQLEIYVN